MEHSDNNFSHAAIDMLRHRRIVPQILQAFIDHWVAEAIQQELDSEITPNTNSKATLALRWHKWHRLLSLSDPVETAEIQKSFINLKSVLIGFDSLTEQTVNPLLHWIDETEYKQITNDLAEFDELLSRVTLPATLSDPAAQELPACRERNLWGSFKDSPLTQKSHFWRFSKLDASSIQ